MSIVPKISANSPSPAEIGDRRSWCEAGTSAAGIRLKMVRSNVGSSTASARLENFAFFPSPSAEKSAPENRSARRLLAAARSLRLRFQDGDILVVKHKVVSKAEGALVALDEIRPSAASRAWARRYGLDARVRELAVRESRRIVRRKRNVLITETKHGFICANSGVDVSNVDGGRHAVLLPADPDRSAARLRRELKKQLGIEIAVIVSDSFRASMARRLDGSGDWRRRDAASGRLPRTSRSAWLLAARDGGRSGGRTGLCGGTGLRQADTHSRMHHSRL